MAEIQKRRRSSARLLIARLLGVLGLFLALLGGLGALAIPEYSFVPAWKNIGQFGHLSAVSTLLLVAGAAFVALALLELLFNGLRTLAGRRNVVGIDGAVQTALVLVLLVGVNAFSFQHYQRYDWTGRAFDGIKLVDSGRFPQQFTLPESVAADLRELRGETTVVVYQRHKTFGQLSDKPDAFDYAAERKVVEKVQDLVRLFREFGPQFRVVLLDVEDEGYDQKLKALTDDNPALRKAIDAAPDNSILFHTHRERVAADGAKSVRESVQRLSFNDFYQLDKSASRAANDGKGNLVLLPQGVESFARRVLAIEEKKPRIGLCVIHEWLSTSGLSDFSMAGLRKTLETNGFEVTDIVMKKGWGEGEPSPAAYTLSESQLERLEEDLAEYDAIVAINREELKGMSGLVEKLKSPLSLDDLNKLLAPILQGRKMNDASRKANIANLEPQLEALKEILAQQEKERAETLKQLEALPGQERIAEGKRATDVKQKLDRLLADCDLVILPRMTLRNVIVGDRIPARLYRLEAAQSDAIKDFMKAGKPVFALFGPSNEPAERRGPAPVGPDSMEALFAQLGITFGNQTILFNKEAKAFSQRRASLLATGSEVEIPPVYFEKPKSTRRGDLSTEPDAQRKPNRIAESMKIVAGAAGSADKLEKLKLRHPRPVYYTALDGQSTAEFLYADSESWNESDPFPTREKTPRYDPPKADDPMRNSRDAEKPGPFEIGVAVERKVPAEWLAGDKTIRVAAIGQGDVFNGPDLSPAREQLLLHSCNWLLARDERLPSADRPAWSYPRVALSPRRLQLWQSGTLLGLPAAVACLGALVLLVRKYR